MKFKDILQEKYKETIEVDGMALPIFINPNKKELQDIMKENPFKSVRLGITDSPRPTIYAWDGEVYHADMKLFRPKNKFNVGFTYEQGIPHMIEIFGMNAKKWGLIKNKDKIIETIKKMFPKVTKLGLTNMMVDV